MNRMILTIALATAGIMLAGCGEKEQTVEWYKQHDAERQAMVEKCKKDVADPQSNTNCRNAISADIRSESNITRTLPKTWHFDSGSSTLKP